jgi:hypothetical protein
VIDLKSDAPSSAPTNQPYDLQNPAPDDMTTFKQKLEKLKMMKDMSMLSNEEFDAEKAKLLGSL